MSQYKTGTATVTNGSPTVTGTNTLWLANVTAGDSFTVAGDGVMYDVASVDSDTQVTLSVNYAGSTASGAVYAIGTGFTVPDNFPEMSQGDIETATIFTRAMRKIQGKISSILAGGANANFASMPQVGGDPIVESGSNADGEWTKWADGTQIASTSNFAFSSVTSAADWRDSWTFPIAFLAQPKVTPPVLPTNSAEWGNPDSRYVISFCGYATSTSTTGTPLRVWAGGSSANGAISSVQVTAIGRWK